ncbi:MAG TPA: GAF domain-containing protein [Ignavibacteria bacterium]|nr:GAF domain-containing protein [Ignavibacteria bacterium]
MAFTIDTSAASDKSEIYKTLIPQINSLIEGENNLTANLGNICAALKYSFYSFIWVGFYLKSINNKNELILGPFQGRVACTRITFGKGVCGKAAENKETVIVDNVNEFPGHIVCDPLSKSEIVIPVIINKETVAVLDIDSGEYSNFDETDKEYLEKMIDNIKHIFKNE